MLPAPPRRRYSCSLPRGGFQPLLNTRGRPRRPNTTEWSHLGTLPHAPPPPPQLLWWQPLFVSAAHTGNKKKKKKSAAVVTSKGKATAPSGGSGNLGKKTHSTMETLRKTGACPQVSPFSTLFLCYAASRKIVTQNKSDYPHRAPAGGRTNNSPSRLQQATPTKTCDIAN